MKKIKLTQGKFALVDNEDFDFLNSFKWYYLKNAFNKNGYAVRNSPRKNRYRQPLRMHRIILNIQKGVMCDHIDGNGLNNQKSNLRICNNTENSRNRTAKGKNNTSGYKGVGYLRGKSGQTYIRAEISYNKKTCHLGLFKTTKEAAIAYNRKAIELFGEFARLNKV